MPVRISDQTRTRLAQRGMAAGRSGLDTAYRRASTGRLVSTPSDHPPALRQMLELATIETQQSRFLSNMDRGTALLTGSEGALDGATNILIRAREIAVQGSGATVSASERALLGREVRELQAELSRVANTEVAGVYVFGGFRNRTPAFDAQGAFAGTSDVLRLEVGLGVTQDVQVRGDEAFKGVGITGGVDLFASLSSLATALTNGEAAATRAELDPLGRGIEQLTRARAHTGILQGRILTAKNAVEAQRQAAREQRNRVVDVDVVEAVSDLTKREQALRVTLQASERVLQSSLLSFLR